MDEFQHNLKKKKGRERERTLTRKSDWFIYWEVQLSPFKRPQGGEESLFLVLFLETGIRSTAEAVLQPAHCHCVVAH